MEPPLPANAVTVELPVPTYPLKLEEILAAELFLKGFADEMTKAFLAQTGETLTDRQCNDRSKNLRAILGGFFLGEPYTADTQLTMLGDFVSSGKAIRQEHGDALVQVLRSYEQRCQGAISAIERPFAIPSDSWPAIRKDDIDLIFQNLGTIADEQIQIVQRAERQLKQLADSLDYRLKRGLNDMKPFSNDCRFIPAEQLRAYSPPSVASLLALPDFYPGELAEGLAGGGKGQAEGGRHARLLAALYRSAFLGLYAQDKFLDWSLFPAIREELISYRVPRFDATVLKIRTLMASGAAGAFLVGRLMSEIGAIDVKSEAIPIVIDGIQRDGVSLVYGTLQGKEAVTVVFNEARLRAQRFDGPSIDALIRDHRLTFAYPPPLQPAEERETIDDHFIVQFYLHPERLHADDSSKDNIDFSKLAGPGARLAGAWSPLAQPQVRFPHYDVARIIGRNPLRVWLARNSHGPQGYGPSEQPKPGKRRRNAPKNEDPLALFGNAQVQEQVGAAVWRIRGQKGGNPFIYYVNVFPSADGSDKSLKLIKHYAAAGLADASAFQPSEIAGAQVLIASSLGPETLDELLTFLHWRQEGMGQRPQYGNQLRAVEYELLAQFAQKVGAFLAHSPREQSVAADGLRTVEGYLRKFEQRFLAWVSREGFPLFDGERETLLAAQRELASVYTAGPIVMKTDRTPRNEVVDASGKLHSIDFKEPCIYVPLGAAVADAFGFSWYITNERGVPFRELRPFLKALSEVSENDSSTTDFSITDETPVSVKDFCVLACFLGYQRNTSNERSVLFGEFTKRYWAAAPQRAFNSTATAQGVYGHRGSFSFIARFVEQDRMREGIKAMEIGNLLLGQTQELPAALAIHRRILEKHIERYGAIPPAVLLA